MHIPRKRFGQHFLHDPNIIERIVAVIAPSPDDHMVEIGPGLGALTTQVLPLVKKLEVVELDRDVIPKLKEICNGLGELIIYQADALKFNFKELVKKNQSLRVVGNLPYNISTPLLFHLLEYADVIQDMYFMLQKEVVERIVAQPGEEAYGRLSVMVQYQCEVENLFIVKPGAFSPPPKVDSAIIKIIPYKILPFPTANQKLFADVVRLAFGQRRKTLRNSLRTLLDATQLEKIGIDPMQRPEELSVADYVKITNAMTPDFV